MKKILLFLLAILPCYVLMGQGGEFLVENFDGTSMPTGWTVLNQVNNWSISQTNNAGGEPNELRLYYNPSFNGKTRVVSPIIDLSGETDVVIEFLHNLDNYTGGHIIGIETTSDGGASWNLAFQKNYNSSGNFSVVEIINTDDVGSSTFQFCLFYEGNSYNINYWYFDNFELYGRKNLDAAVQSINMDAYATAGNHTPKFTVSNKGITTINSLKVQYQYNDLPPVVETFSDLNIASLTSYSLTFSDPSFLIPGSYELEIKVLEANGVKDDLEDNDALTRYISLSVCEAKRIVTIEHFTSSTCGPCVTPNSQMRTLLSNNPGKYSISKYQMSWPSPGDPYYTAEGGVRREYYKVNAVPAIFFNGHEISGVNQNNFDNVLNTPAFLDIIGVFDVNNQTVTVHFDAISYINIPEARIYVVVNEKNTTENEGTNGEEEFNHVMMKFLPDAQGTTSSFIAGEPKSFDFSQDLSSTNVEEYDDLEVNVFIQEYGSKYIFNSKFLLEDVSHPYPPKDLSLQNNENEATFTVTWKAPDDKTPTGYNIYLNGELVESNYQNINYVATYDAGLKINWVEVASWYGPDIESVHISDYIINSAETFVINASVDGEGGSISPSGNVEVAEGASQTFTITPDEGFSIAQVLIDGSNNEEAVANGEYTFENVVQNHSIVAVFKDNSGTFYVITATKEGDGTLNPMGEVEVKEGESQTFSISKTVSEEQGYFEIYIDGEIFGDIFLEATYEYTFENVTSAHTIHVKFTTYDNIIENGANSISVYPNPASDKVYLEGFDKTANITFYLFDINGRLLHEFQGKGDVIELNMTNYANGAYFLKCGDKIVKIIKN
ncbi:MAG: T9SS type A sorting domain-containing protein [Bacteroidales bacterium]|jgi:hypothetical protein|nr:T9SS type A sorting domain-containing protein [Bacteroidales bacterium]